MLKTVTGALGSNRQPWVCAGAAVLFAWVAGCADKGTRHHAEPRSAATGPASIEPPAAPARADGLIIEDLELGDGPVVRPGGVIKVRYVGMLADGTVFFKTDPDGAPVEYPLTRLIAGWQEGVPGMRVGGKRRLRVPAAMGYGARTIPDDDGNTLIPPNSDLIFEITVVGAR
jgi:FKBP-type peptidyl-prolyl cis-trans isomerase